MTGAPRPSAGRAGKPPAAYDGESTHYSYEDEDQSAAWNPARVKPKPATPLRNYNSIDNIAEFFASRGKKFNVPKLPAEEPTASVDSVPGRRSSTRNMAKERSISAKGMGKTPRLRYNSLASV